MIVKIRNIGYLTFDKIFHDNPYNSIYIYIYLYIHVHDSSRRILINLSSESWQQNRLRQQQAC